MLTHLRTFDAQDGWANMGLISTAVWLAWRTELGTATAREHVRVARAPGVLPGVDAAFAAGQLSYAKVRAITRVATPATEQDFIDVAMHATASQIEKVAAAYRRVRVDPSEPPMDLRRFMRRSDTRSGMVRIELQLPPEQANVVWEAMSAALETGRREGRDVSAETSTGAAEDAPPPGAIRVSAETSATGHNPGGRARRCVGERRARLSATQTAHARQQL